ncbi:MAG: sugar ABC transporter ATP-binding protein [Firmicutes bacterium]|nr:sugar ABC transporter ATP-binding protein [Bacillota bacterium]
MAVPPLIALEGVGKRFDGVAVLRDVSFDIRSGEVVSLCGANGAGKSTLIKIMTGYYESYQGRVRIDGTEARLHSPSGARAAGIDAVYQEVDTCIAPDLSVAENLILYRLANPHYPLWQNRRRIEAEARAIAQTVDLRVDMARPARLLTLQQKQLLVIARALAQRARVLIFDEPTASLSQPEVERLFATIRDLRNRGLGILYVSHRLSELLAISDRVLVLRNGELVQSFDSVPTARDIATAMLGAPPPDDAPQPYAHSAGPTVLEAIGIEVRGKVHGVSFAAARGEILGITGLVGAGKTELLRALFGADARTAGEIRLHGRLVHIQRPTDAVKNGIYLVPEERRRHGLFLDFPVYKNLSSVFLARFCRLGVIDAASERRGAAQMIERLHISGAVEGPVAHLSGGNQQKVVLGKWLFGDPQVLLLDEVTQGVDVGTRQEIYRLVREMSQRAAVLFASSDIDEVLSLADRLLVMRDGRVVGSFARGEVDRQTILELAANVEREMVV